METKYLFYSGIAVVIMALVQIFLVPFMHIMPVAACVFFGIGWHFGRDFPALEKQHIGMFSHAFGFIVGILLCIVVLACSLLLPRTTLLFVVRQGFFCLGLLTLGGLVGYSSGRMQQMNSE
jgi:hypothetical protein